MRSQEVIAQIEEKMKKRFGEHVTHHPRAFWTTEDEQEFLRQEKDLYVKIYKAQKKKDFKRRGDFLISKKIRKSNKGAENCPVCKKYNIFFSFRDDVKLVTHGCCYNCYINFVEDREERWESGWRPKLEE